MNAEHQPVFTAELTPHRSLSRPGFRILMLITGVLALVHAGFFFATGAWPVGMFFGVDFLLLWGAFKLNYRAGRAREEVSVSRSRVAIRQFSPAGQMKETVYNPFFARFHVRRHPEIGITTMAVAGQGRVTRIGAFLNPDDRESFALAMRRAFATVKQRI